VFASRFRIERAFAALHFRVGEETRAIGAKLPFGGGMLATAEGADEGFQNLDIIFLLLFELFHGVILANSSQFGNDESQRSSVFLPYPMSDTFAFAKKLCYFLWNEY
jgi:hypothetical protein